MRDFDAIADAYRKESCGGDMLGATWHQLRVYHALREAAQLQRGSKPDPPPAPPPKKEPIRRVEIR